MDGFNSKINIFVLSLLLALAGLANAQQWQELNTGVTENLYSVYCVDTNTIFVCGWNGVILKSEDGGNTWQEKYRQERYDWSKIKFLDNNIGFVLGDDGNYNNKLFKTIDGGETWQDMGSPFTEYDVCDSRECDIFIVDADTLYVASGHQLMKSSDGGTSFSLIDLFIYVTLDLYFEENVGYVVWGDAGTYIGSHMAKTTDYGTSWEEIFTYDYDSEDEGIKKAFFHDKDHVSVYGSFGYDENEDHCMYNEIRTDDGFATYQWLQDGNYGNYFFDVWPPISGVCFSDFQNGIITYEWHNSSIFSFQTQDGGGTWHELNLLYGQGSISGREGVYYLACERGRVYKLQGTYDGVVEEKESVFAFPNPTNDRVVIEGIEAAEVQIYNAIGKCVASAKCKGEPLTIDISSLPAGVYFVNITDGEGRKCVKKVVKE